ncbi:hypothetical protein [Acidipropionibacterium thoenii]|uniref:hypothetical protein n=1 Tax=Acidipropionibacterium thoenii TaxID=1751 RepID=UPI000687A68C|nr:hypothetical protein [Acidipropionibacterium thoenii]
MVKLTGLSRAAFLVGTGGGAVGPLAALLAGGFQVPVGEGSGAELLADGDPGAEAAGVERPGVGAPALVDALAAEDAAGPAWAGLDSDGLEAEGAPGAGSALGPDEEQAVNAMAQVPASAASVAARASPPVSSMAVTV